MAKRKVKSITAKRRVVTTKRIRPRWRSAQKPVRRSGSSNVIRRSIPRTLPPSQVIVKQPKAVDKRKNGIVKVPVRALRQCQKNKLYKKSMLKQIAAQVARAGAGGLSSWRNKRAKNRKTTWEC